MLPTIMIGSIGIHSFWEEMERECMDIMTLTCSEQAKELNVVLGEIEQSVNILSQYAIDNLENVESLWKDEQYFNNYTTDLTELGITVAEETDGAIAVYVRYNKGTSANAGGFLQILNSETGSFEEFEMTDLSLYDEIDLQYVGWYYVPKENGKAIWLQPYYNKNLDIYMISYVIPIYKDRKLIGIVGMDIDFDYIIKKVDEIQIYDTGHAFLANKDLKIVYSPHYPKGTDVRSLGKSFQYSTWEDILNHDKLYKYTYQGDEKKVIFNSLANDMCLAVTVPAREVQRNAYELAEKTIVTMLISIGFFLAITISITKDIVKPLKKLNLAASEIANGNLDIELECKTKDEIGTLTKNLKETARQLKIKIDYINTLAFQDKLTGVKNNTAYLSEISNIKEEISKDAGELGVFVIDVNGLKEINDRYGHDCGNELLITAARLLVKCFEYENVYRIGGDEFVILLKNSSLENCKQLTERFEQMLQEENDKVKVAAAVGYVVHNMDEELNYEKLFKRADEEMYRKKQQMKIEGKNSIVNV